VQLDVNIAAQAVTLNVNIANSAVTLDINIKNPIDAEGNLKTSIQSSVQLNVNIAAQAVTLDVNIASSAATLDVNIANSAVTLNVNVTNTQLDVNIAASAVTLNVSVQGTASVSIDNANIYLGVENAKNRGGSSSFDNTANATTLLTDYAGFGVYVRNMHGGLLVLRLKVKETSGTDQTLTVCFSINPSLPPIYETTVDVPANTDGLTPTKYIFNLWWNYDTIFVYIAETNPNVQVYTESGVWGTYAYQKTGAQFNSINYGIGIIVKTRGGTFNSLPVSGIVNTISIPNSSAAAYAETQDVPAGGEITAVTINACGRTTYIALITNYERMEWRIYVDGELLELEPTVSPHATLVPYYLWWAYAQNDLVTGNGINLARNAAINRYNIFITTPIEFRKRLEIRARNPDTTAHSISARVLYNKLT